MIQAAEILCCSLLTVHRYIKDGRLAAEKAPGRNGAVRVCGDSLHQLVSQRTSLKTRTLDTRTAAEMLHCRERTVQRLVKAGRLTALDGAPGRGLRILPESIAAYEAERHKIKH